MNASPGETWRVRDARGDWADWFMLDGPLLAEARELGYKGDLVAVLVDAGGRGRGRGYKRKPDEFSCITNLSDLEKYEGTWEKK